MKLRILVVLLLVNALLWGRALAHPGGLDAAEDEARKACTKQGWSLRALQVTYDEAGAATRVNAVCGLPKLTSA